MGETELKVREKRARRMAERQGLRLVKSPRRDPLALDYGTFRIERRDGAEVVAQGSSSGYGLALEDVERELSAPWGGRPWHTGRNVPEGAR